jgi:hypothetical protein
MEIRHMHDHELIGHIGRRAVSLLGWRQFDVVMDIDVCHEHCALDLARLLNASDSDFAHDVVGINAHLDHDTGELTDGFHPRFAVNQ